MCWLDIFTLFSAEFSIQQYLWKQKTVNMGVKMDVAYRLQTQHVWNLETHFENFKFACVLAYQYSRTGKFGNNGLHCEPFVIKGCDWTGESQVKTVPIGQKKVISY